MTASAVENSTADSKEAESSTTAKLAIAAHNAVDIAAANLEQAEKALREARASAGLNVDETVKQAQSLSEDALGTVKAYIELYPLRSVGIALATGYLLSALLRK
ncbi:MAG: hypothetical protein R3E64_10960 [Halioglobus sp.]